MTISGTSAPTTGAPQGRKWADRVLPATRRRRLEPLREAYIRGSVDGFLDEYRRVVHLYIDDVQASPGMTGEDVLTAAMNAMRNDIRLL